MDDLVIDASVASAWCFPDDGRDYANAVLHAVSSSLVAMAPRLWAYEVRNSVLMGVRRGRISKTDATVFLESLADLNIRLADPVSDDVVFNLAELSGLPVYDAAYLDIAIRHSAQIASLDEALQKAAVRAGVSLFELPIGG